jgi:hypothetical protein
VACSYDTLQLPLTRDSETDPIDPKKSPPIETQQPLFGRMQAEG